MIRAEALRDLSVISVTQPGLQNFELRILDCGFSNRQSAIDNRQFARPPSALRPPLTRGVPLSFEFQVSMAVLIRLIIKRTLLSETMSRSVFAACSCGVIKVISSRDWSASVLACRTSSFRALALSASGIQSQAACSTLTFGYTPTAYGTLS